MQIPVLGMDPSLRNWGLAEAMLDLKTGHLTLPQLSLVQPKDAEGKQVRQNSSDLFLAEQLATGVLPAAQRAKVVFVECPVGSQSARAMTSYGVCVGVLGTIRALGIPLIEVTATEVKQVFTGDRNATKARMISQAIEFYPEANFPRHAKNGKGYRKGDIVDKAEHVADAIAAIHAGARTSAFQNLMRLFAQV